MCRRSIADCLGPTLETISRILTILHARGALEFDLTAPTTSRFAINELEGAIVRRVGDNAAFRPATVLKHIILQLAERTYQAADEPFRQPSCNRGVLGVLGPLLPVGRSASAPLRFTRDRGNTLARSRAPAPLIDPSLSARSTWWKTSGSTTTPQ